MATIKRYKLAQLSELRFVCQEVGTLSDARALPVEIRKWWIEQMQKKGGEGGESITEEGGRRFRTVPVK